MTGGYGENACLFAIMASPYFAFLTYIDDEDRHGHSLHSNRHFEECINPLLFHQISLFRTSLIYLSELAYDY